MEALKRDPNNDYPLLVILELIGSNIIFNNYFFINKKLI